ncbi:hypothetical protein JX265_006801 [Neoarthrinium moseri]|uniref:Uncharacterized protein n=1 Tax=Neoarthrinium moseri TaxID=1658444 RepID=A0A9Q0AQC1_9PEZI|nr:uncharacterized protein JN550_002723 [Neoarthrinium moseri]KAI1847002.1 hypothetical protein JX266_006877 [Neoarthrinium moseri]KAI1868822.1 hypothetical protein JX265_006801 [Neoarthrinium moseri]KAI1874144.1 hypothetical protein JN550_002723 [Neoarthrinium moseri]
MQLQFITLLVGLVAVSSAAVADVEGVRNVARDSIVISRQANGNRPTPSGACCVASTSLKQDTCTATDGTQGRCVPGGNNLADENPLEGGGTLSCVAQSKLTCDAAIIERGKSLCRANAGNGKFIDGAQTISSLSQAKVN